MPILAARATLNNPDLGPSSEQDSSAEKKRTGSALSRPSWLPTYIPELEGLRGLAVLGVVIYHCHTRLEGSWIHYPSLWGWAGVNLFFTLSGFLITSILIESRDKPRYFRNFYARRVLRIWPVYLSLLAICYSVPDWFLGDTLANQTHWKTLLAYALFIQNLRHVALPGSLGPTWSLAIEEQYYFLWAPIVRFCRGPILGWLLPGLLSAMVVASPLIRHLNLHWVTRTSTLTHLDGIALGSLLALGLHRHKLARNAWLAIGLMASTAGFVCAATIAGGTSMLDSALAVGFGGVVLTCVAPTGFRNPVLSILRRGPLPFYGKISYGLYMTHILVFIYFGSFDARLDSKSHAGVASNLLIVALRLAASTAVATALWYGFESQILKLKRYF